MMKRSIFNALLALGLAAALAACSSPAQEETQPTQTRDLPDSSQTVQAADSGYVFTAPNGVTVAIDDDMAQVLEALGEPRSYFEAASCAFEGLDKTYTYSGFTIITRPEEADLVTSILLTDDSVATPEGVYIGSPAEDVAAVYGEPDRRTDTLLSYTKGGTTLNFILSDGAVLSIEYLQA